MQIPKEIAEKVEQYEVLKQESDSLYDEVKTWLINNADMEDVFIGELFITDEPTGDRQSDDGEYCDQYQGYIEDDYSGIYYHKIENSDKYLAYDYCC